ncbi:hypothetical protein ACT3S7_12220 [Corynebacterium sp. AOP34-AQ2-28]|uniref:hypothetical protein n=1 Tax=Corynebacterium sp. AOP34-AQ2-28 TaxID=3457689 RepID=UPI004034496B
MVGFDTEFATVNGERVIASYQFCVVDPEDRDLMVQMVILPLSGRRIRLSTALHQVWLSARLWEHPAVKVKGVSVDGVPVAPVSGPGDTVSQLFLDTIYSHGNVPITLVSHYGSADMTTFWDGRNEQDILTRLTSAAGGLVTLQPVRVPRYDVKRRKCVPFTFSVIDTMAQAPAGQKSLAALGMNCGVPKLEVPGDWISRMHEYRSENLAAFLDYGINDAVICLEYLARVFGDDVLPPVTLSSGGAKAMVSSATEYWGITKQAFKQQFGGLVKTEDAAEVVDAGDGLSYYVKRGLQPVDGQASSYLNYAAQAYHGGLNSCPTPGYYTGHTVDVDAQNAYPTAMGAVLDLNFCPGNGLGVVEEVWKDRRLTLADVPDPTVPVTAYVRWEFPDDVVYPCIPVMADSTILYPRTSEGINGAYVMGPELWLALKLGAEVYCSMGYKARVLAGPTGGPSRVLRHGVAQLIADRNLAKKVFGKMSLEETTLKNVVNSIYGKTAQDISEHAGWNAMAQVMESVGGSAISSPHHAATTTSLVRAQLHAVMNQITNAGCRVFSVTTDGFITDMPIDQVEDLDLFGLAPVLRDSRVALTGDPTIWEAKHEQDRLLNFTTRGNTSLDPGGVNAHNGYKIPRDVVEDSMEDRQLMHDLVVTREGRIPNPGTQFPSFQQLSDRYDRRDFLPFPRDRALSMDYDLKRRPVMSSMAGVVVADSDGDGQYEVASFDTEPWETVAEATRGREVGKEIGREGCLRTVEQWEHWDLQRRHGARGRSLKHPDKAILRSILIGYRHGMIDIPALDQLGTVAERCAWLSGWGLGTVTESQWKNARRPERASGMLPVEDLEPWVTEISDAPVDWGGEGVVAA